MRLGRLQKKKRDVFCQIALCLLLAALPACGQPESEAPKLPLPGARVLVPETEAPKLPLPEAKVLVPETGALSEASGDAVIDYSNASEGYIMAKYTGSKDKVKLMIEKGGTSYKYDLDAGGEYEVFPLTMDDGSYQVGVYENVSGAQYAVALTATVDVTLTDPLLPYLYPSQYVDFDAGSAAVAKGKELAAGAESQLEIVSDVYNFVTGTITYDRQKAATVQPGYLPSVDEILSAGQGICFDYAALMAAILRSQGIPTRLEVGYVSGGLYHAWISVYTRETGWVNDVIRFDGENWSMMDPTLASGAGGGNQDLIGDGTGYSLMYQY